MAEFSFGRTKFKPPSLFQRLKNMKMEDIKKLRWKDLTPEQRKKIIIGGVVFFLLLLFIGIAKR